MKYLRSPLLRLTPAEVHDELSFLGVSSEVHALVDDLGLVPVVDDPGRTWRVKRKAWLKTCSAITVKEHVYQPHTIKEEKVGRLF